MPRTPGGHATARNSCVNASRLSGYLQNEFLATGRFLTVLPGFMLKIPGRFPALKALPVALPNKPLPIGIITLKDRTLTPIAQLFIDSVRAVAKPLASR
jgi:DNA-binding transcriptional LysR family regulator